jgi:8-oxo-dGTP pyrophosphatase MutT (NUDIX family)
MPCRGTDRGAWSYRASDVMRDRRIRPIAICLFHRGGRILVFEGHDPVKGETFYRPLGGGIEFGERGEETIAREIREEVGAEVANLRFLGPIENIFTFMGEPGHEIVLVYDGDLANPALYEREALDLVEEDGTHFKGVWKSPGEFSEVAPLYPAGLLEMLSGWGISDRPLNVGGES